MNTLPFAALLARLQRTLTAAAAAEEGDADAARQLAGYGDRPRGPRRRGGPVAAGTSRRSARGRSS